MNIDTDVKIPEAPKDPLLQLVSLQKASGCWEMGSSLAELFGKTEKELIKQIPAQVSDCLWKLKFTPKAFYFDFFFYFISILKKKKNNN